MVSITSFRQKKLKLRATENLQFINRKKQKLMTNSSNTLPTLYQSIIHKSRYARFLPKENRRESWEETVDRLINYIKPRVPESHKDKVAELKSAILNLEVMPSMRLMMTAGEACDRDNISAYNCSYLAVNNKRAFSEEIGRAHV